MMAEYELIPTVSTLGFADLVPEGLASRGPKTARYVRESDQRLEKEPETSQLLFLFPINQASH